MLNMLCLSAAGLEISWLTILLHMVNLVILIAILWLLLYKPIKKFIKKRQDTFKSVIDENKTQQDENTKLKEKYEELIDEATQEVAKASVIAKEQVEEQKQQILADAKHQAEEIKSIAVHEAEKEKKRMENAMKEDAVELATEIAGKIVQREIKPEDNKKIIDECLGGWKNSEK